MNISTKDYDHFIVTGLLYNSKKRFRQRYTSDYVGLITAFGINLWRGSIWGILRTTKKRKLLKRVWN